MTAVATNADPGRGDWAIDDPILRLRAWGHDDGPVFELASDATEWTLGTAPECTIQLVDPAGRVSRRHAELVRRDGVLSIRDLESTNGLRQDGERRQSFQVAPGTEIEIGGVTLVAESARSIALRALISRLLGWEPRRAPDVDRALRAVRDMATQRAVLILCGEGDLVPLARRLGRHALGPERPFVTCGPDDGDGVLERCDGGTLCLVTDQLPREVASIATGVRLPGSRARVAICAPNKAGSARAAMMFGRASLVEITPLAERTGDTDRLIAEFAADAVEALGAPGTGFRTHDMLWLRALAMGTLDQFDEVTLRLVALRNWRLTGGAERLGISHVALSKWMRRRKIPT